MRHAERRQILRNIVRKRRWARVPEVLGISV